MTMVTIDRALIVITVLTIVTVAVIIIIHLEHTVVYYNNNISNNDNAGPRGPWFVGATRDPADEQNMSPL